jgi:MarR family 2-MHQ and catechol resistance regulon transcriptional repressor
MGTHHQGAREEVEALDAFIKLTRAADSVMAALQPGLAEQGLTSSQLGVLEALHHLGPLCQRDLGRKLLKSNSNVTTVVDHLEERGLVARQRDAEDRRFVEVRLTAAGRRLVRAVFPAHLERIVALFGALAREERAELSRLCRKLGLAASS